jgi:hypothetical protein
MADKCLPDCLTIGHVSVDVQSWSGCNAVRRTNSSGLCVEIVGHVDRETLTCYREVLEGGSLKAYSVDKLMDFWLISDALRNTELCEALEIALLTSQVNE